MIDVKVLAYEGDPDDYDLGCWTLQVPGISTPVRATNPNITVNGAAEVNKTLRGMLYLELATLEVIPAVPATFTADAGQGLAPSKVEATGTFLRQGHREGVSSYYLVASVMEVEAWTKPPYAPDTIEVGACIRMRGPLYFDSDCDET